VNWELLDFALEDATGPVQIVSYEAVLKDEDSPAGEPLYFRGDGIYIGRTAQLRLNRDGELAGLLHERFDPPKPRYGVKPIVPSRVVDAVVLAAQLSQLLEQRIATELAAAAARVAAAVKPEAAPARRSSPAPMMGSVAYYLRWEK
jgi:hypothetical protein